MTRVGWTILALVLVAGAAFLSMTRFGGPAANIHPAPLSPVGDGGVLNVPVAGVARSSLTDSWGQAREAGREHHGTDIPAPAGTPVVAAADGTVEKLFASARGGTTIYQRSPAGRWIYYYAHLAGYAPGLHEGQRLHGGETIGFVGDTGDAGAGNFHLHFGLVRTEPGQRWWEGRDVNPYPILARTGPGR